MPKHRNKKDGSGRTLLGCAALLLLVFVVYAPSITGDFIWDDDDNVSDNPTLQDTAGLARTWTDLHANQQFYPLVHTSFWIEHQLWKLWSPGYRTTNLVLHALVAALFWFTLRRLAVPGAWVAAAVFAVHPVNVETAAWITERKNLLSAVFYLLALMAYLRFAGLDGAGREPYRRRSMWALSLVLFTLAMLSKTAVLTLPVAIVIIVWWKTGRIPWRDALLVSPMLVVGAVLGAVTASIEWGVVGAAGEEWKLHPAGRILVAGRALWFYCTQLVLPFRVNFIYPRWNVDPAAIWQWAYPAAALAVPVVLWWRRERLGRGPLAAVLLFAVTLSPVLGFLDFYFQIYAFVQDHFQYLASMAMIALLTAFVTLELRKLHERVGQVTAAVVLALFGGLSFVHAGDFTSQETLWKTTLARNPRAWMAHINLGLVYVHAGRLDDAMAQFRESLEIEHVQHDKAHYNIGWILERRGDIEGARAQYQKAIELNPANADAHNNLGIILTNEGRIDEAIEHFKAAIAGEPRHVKARFNLAMRLVQKGQNFEAEKYLREALRLDPAYHDAAQGLARVLQDQGRHPEAIELYRRALELQPKDSQTHFNLGVSLEQVGDYAAAERQYREAIRISPGLSNAYNNLAVLFYRSKRYKEAWIAVRACQASGGAPHPDFLKALAAAQPPPD